MISIMFHSFDLDRVFKMLRIIYFLLCVVIFVDSVAIPKIESSESFSLRTIENDLDHTENRPNVCTTDVCVRESNRIISYMNESVDPCGNFYEFVCGKYIHDTILTEDKYRESAFSLVQDEIDKQLEEALLEEIKPNEPKAFELAKNFTQICMDVATLNRKG